MSVHGIDTNKLINYSEVYPFSGDAHTADQIYLNITECFQKWGPKYE